MDSEEKRGKGTTITIIILIIIILGLAGYIVYYKFIDTDSKDNKDIVEKTKDDKTLEEKGITEYKTYDVSLAELVNNKKDYEYNAGDFKITLKYIGEETVKYGIYVNDKYIVDDYAMNADNKLDVATFGDYLIFVNSGKTGIRSDIIYVVSKEGVLVNKFYELGNDSGMVVSGRYGVSGNKLVINGSREDNGPSIKYNDQTYSDCQSLSQLDQNTAVNAAYSYELKDGKFVLIGSEVTKTLKQFMSETLKCNN